MKHKTLRTGLVLAAVMLLVSISAFAFSGSGQGTEKSPYIIKTVDQLNEIKEDLTVYYKLAANIVINDPNVFEYDENGVIIGVKEGATVNEWIPIENFQGSFDGNRFFITGLYVSDENAYGGIFANTDGATIKHIKTEFSLVESKEYAGLIVGKAENTTFDYCLASGSVIGKTTQVQNTAGGVVGYLGEGSTMTNTVSYATVSGANSYSSNVGGLVGYNAGSITDSASDAKVAGSAKYYDAAVGGIAGSNAGTVQNCTSQATVKGETTSSVNDVYVGGIAGLNNGTITQVKNTGAVSVEKVYAQGDSIAAAGGIVGMMVDVDMNNVSNEGDVSGQYSYNGGIVGIAVSTDETHTLSNAKNTGTVNTANGVNGGIAGRAVAGGEGYITTIMHFENCEASTLYGEAGTVESAQVTGELGTAAITAPTTKAIIEITAPDPQFVTAIDKAYIESSIPSLTYTAANSEYVDAFGDKAIIRYTATSGTNIAKNAQFVPNPVMITAIVVADPAKSEITSVDASALSLTSGKLNGTVVVKFYSPSAVDADAVIGTSVGAQFVNAKFGQAATTATSKLATVEFTFNDVAISGVDASATINNISINAMVVGSTEKMDPLCENYVWTQASNYVAGE